MKVLSKSARVALILEQLQRKRAKYREGKLRIEANKRARDAYDRVRRLQKYG